ncbi:MAG: hypothetical protein Q9160_004859 [Pyrenula sp. 1 TL-2023]
MVVATPSESPFGDSRPGLTIHGRFDALKASVPPAVWVGLTETGVLRLIKDKILTRSYPAFPGDLAPPVVVITTLGATNGQEAPSFQATQELDPARLLRHLRPALDPQPIDDSSFNDICNELTNSAQNGRYWLEWYKNSSKPLSIKSSLMEWEQALYTGHPLHPMHRTFASHDPVPSVPPENITSLTAPSISLISVPGSDVRVTGPFRQALKPLLTQYRIEDAQPGKVILLCMTLQLPMIKQYHPETEVLLKDAFQAVGQSSLRTVAIPFFDYDFKFSLDVTITSSPRIIGPKTVMMIHELSCVLKEIMPDNLWVMGEVGGVTGRSDEFDKNIHIGCLLRENFERRALANNETLAVVGALQEIPPWSTECNAALVFGLRTEEQKLNWLSEYTASIIDAVIGPVLDYGVAFEAHAQNILVRIDRSTGRINGWVLRDLSSIRMHLPTLAKSGRQVLTLLPGSLVPCEDERDLWREIQMTLIQNQLNIWIYRLGISRHAAWSMVREKFQAFFERRKHMESSIRLRNYLFAKEIPHKAFMLMKFGRRWRVYDYELVPNVLLEGLEETAENGVINGQAQLNGHTNHELGEV